MGLGLLFMVIIWGGLIALVIWLVATLFPRGSRQTNPDARELSARQILDRRYARGEITRQQYELMKETIT